MLSLKQTLSFLTIGITLVVAPYASAQSINPETDCSKELILAFFPETFVKATLSKFQVPQDKWDAISKDLASKDRDVIKAVEDKAGKMNPNPLKDPSKQADAVKIFRETLQETFSGVLKAHGVTDDKKIQEMLDDIQAQKAKRFSECFPQAQMPVKTDDESEDLPSSSIDSDEDASEMTK